MSPQHSRPGPVQQTPLHISAGGQHCPSPMHTDPSGQHSPPQHWAGLAQQSCPQTLRPAGQQAPPFVQAPLQHWPLAHWMAPGQGFVGAVVGRGAGVVVGGGGAGMRGRVPLVRASTSERAAPPVSAAPPRPSSPLSIPRRDDPDGQRLREPIELLPVHTCTPVPDVEARTRSSQGMSACEQDSLAAARSRGRSTRFSVRAHPRRSIADSKCRGGSDRR
jgi:hypothetical protein